MSPAVRGGVLAGLGNQTRREAATWWANAHRWRQALVWSVVIGGLLAGMLWVLPAILAGVNGAVAVQLEPVEAAAQFGALAVVLTGAGVVISSQGLLLDARRAGLLERLLSKPLARPALLLAGLVGHSSGLLAAAVVVPWLAVWALLSVAAGQPWSAGRVAGTAVLAALVVLFHVGLVLALSVVTGSRGVVLAVPLALLVGADLISAAAPWTAHVSPYVVGRLAAGLLATGELMAVGPLLATVACTGMLLKLALWRFAGEEL